MRFFNTEGPVRPDDHYAIAPLDRVDIDEFLGLIQAKRKDKRTDWVPNARTAPAVHWNQPRDEAQKEFERRGYEGITGFESYPFSNERNCGAARKVARDKAAVKEEGCYAFIDGGIFANLEGSCRIYRFEFERYAGAKLTVPHHPRNCHNMR